MCVVATHVEMNFMSSTNMMKSRAVRQDFAPLEAMRTATKLHELILDEISTRESSFIENQKQHPNSFEKKDHQAASGWLHPG